MRAPFQVLVIPFRHTPAGIQFAVLKRSDAGWWQFVAGGGEDGESPLQAAQRETKEEIGIAAHSNLMQLDSIATIPKKFFSAAAAWDENVFVIPEYGFAVDVGNAGLTLSPEHTELQWAGYEETIRLLEWDSNRNALWEVNERYGSPLSPPVPS